MLLASRYDMRESNVPKCVRVCVIIRFFASSLYFSSLSNRPELGERVVLRSTRLLLLCGNARCELLCVHLTPFWCSSHSVGFSPEFMYICIRIFVLLDLTWSKKKIIYKQKVIQNVGSYSLFCSRTVMHLKRWTIHAPQNASFSNWYTYFGMDSMNLFSLSYNIEKEKKTPPTTTATAKQ